jgi:hypothetical protein
MKLATQLYLVQRLRIPGAARHPPIRLRGVNLRTEMNLRGRGMCGAVPHLPIRHRDVNLKHRDSCLWLKIA